MPIDFFKSTCQEQPIQAKAFGLCDNQNGEKAFTDLLDNNNWIAIVENNSQIPIKFTAIDNCIEILRPNGEMDNRCDGMLTYTDNIVFVELKIQRTRWITDAIDQLETTIQHFIDHHDIDSFRHKRAFACNKKHPHFQVLDFELKQRFYQTYKIRLNVQASIAI